MSPVRPVRPVSRPVRRRRFLAAVFLAYLVTLAFIAFWPSPVDAGSSGQTLSAALNSLHKRGVPGWFNYNFVEFTANILLFVPFGFLLAAYLDRRWLWTVPPAGLLISCAIEPGQLVFLPDRYATLYDIAANTLGSLLGLALFVSCWIRRRERNSKENMSPFSDY